MIKLLLATIRPFAPYLGLLAVTSDAYAAGQKKQLGPNQETFFEYKAPRVEDLAKAAAQDQIRGQAINSILVMLDRDAKKNPQAFELILRLSELYLERHDYLRDLELAEYDRAISKWKGPDSKESPPQVSHKESQGQLIKAAATLRKLVQEFPKNPRADLALFTLGRTLARLNNSNAETYYKQLIRDFPKSDLQTEAHLALGEWYFDKYRMDEAVKAYKVVVQDRDSPLYVYGVYKLGWAFFNSSPSPSSVKVICGKKLLARLSLSSNSQTSQVRAKRVSI